MDYSLFKQVCQNSQENLKKSLYKVLKQRYKNVKQTKEYLYAEGNIPIALVAHLDTVWDKPPRNIFYDREQQVIWSDECGIGDDRAGVYAILEIIRNGLRPHVIFLTDEEVGGIGASVLASKKCPFKELRYMIELDRAHARDCVFYNCNNKEFIEYVESFDFTYDWGTFTDISILAPAWGVAAVNLSIGYYNEHTSKEMLRVDLMFETINKVKKMLTAMEIPSFKYIKGRSYSFNFSEKCKCCNQTFMEQELFPVMQKNSKIVYYCPDCLVEKCDWCENCGQAYVKDGQNYCYYCRETRQYDK